METEKVNGRPVFRRCGGPAARAAPKRRFSAGCADAPPSGASGAPVLAKRAEQLSVRRRQLHQPGVTQPKQIRPRIGAAELDIHAPHAHGHPPRHFQQFQPDAARRRRSRRRAGKSGPSGTTSRGSSPTPMAGCTRSIPRRDSSASRRAPRIRRTPTRWRRSPATRFSPMSP